MATAPSGGSGRWSGSSIGFVSRSSGSCTTGTRPGTTSTTLTTTARRGSGPPAGGRGIRLSGGAGGAARHAILLLGLATVVLLAPLPLGAARNPFAGLLQLAVFALGAVWVVGGVVRGRLVVRAHPWHLPLALLGSLGLAQWLAAVLGLGGAQDPLALPQLAPTRISTTSPWMTRSALVQVLAYGVLLVITR